MNRRPIASRESGWARRIAAWLAAKGVSPNRISQASLLAAVLAGLCLWAGGRGGGAALLVAGALLVQLRLLCNLFDGMVAVEGGKAAPDGGFWNEFPDRPADIAILAGLGYGAGEPALGWAAAGLAVLTAYTRELGRGLGAPADFGGPMAKPHRMAAVTAGALVGCFWVPALAVTLWVVAVGAALTVALRAWRIVAHFNRP